MSRFRVALSGDFRNPDGSPAYPMFDLGTLHAAGAEVAYVEPVDRVMPASGLAGFDALILLGARFEARSVPEDGRLAVVARFGVGFDNVDTDACTRADIALVTTPDGVRRPVAVSVITFMLALAGRLMDKDRLTRMGPAGWAQRSAYMGVGLTGRTFAQLGVGNIGAEVFRLLKPFDMRLIAHDPYCDPALARDLGVTLVGIETLFREADFLSISVPLNAETRGLVNAERLAWMKPTAFLINTARGPIVDQKALTRALQERRIAGAGLDVFEEEPTAADEPLLTLDNVILAPHALCWTDECFAGNGAVDVDAVLAVMRGEVPTRGLVVNREVRHSPGWQAKLARLRAMRQGEVASA
ncbi:MAG TPA: NAD(P)-dependent oxidoreductase [Beijerinckiaceae bacterium]|nr:NAD(P)-dependent oxidoreductase [Beijerinckiaceae bacterium]